MMPVDRTHECMRAEKQNARPAYLKVGERRIQLVRLNNSSLKSRLLRWVHADEFSRAPLVFKLHDAVNQRKQSVVFAAADILARLPFRAALTRENISAEHALAAELLQAKPLRIRVAPVSG